MLSQSSRLPVRYTSLLLVADTRGRRLQMNYYSHLVLPVVIGLSAMSVSSGASPVADAPGQGLLLVANKGDHTLGIVDPEAGNEQESLARKIGRAHV